MLKRPRLQTLDFRIGWICALQIEVDAARIVLDEEYEDLHEAATYILGRVGRHNVVIACPPAGETGIGAAAVTAERLRASFSAIKYWFMIGIGGGVPGSNDIRLGDVVISQPYGEYGGVVQYDKGKTGPGGQQMRTGSLNAPPQELLAAVTKFRSNVTIGRTNLNKCLDALGSTARFARPNEHSDILFQAAYNHAGGSTCIRCRSENIISRTPRQGSEIVVHYGLIASGNQVIKDGVTRDLISNKFGGVLCFEMEAAGLMNNIPCLVVRGVCDYADSHKNKVWQPFAAASAASCAKEVLSCVPSTGGSNNIDEEQDIIESRPWSASRASTAYEPAEASSERAPPVRQSVPQSIEPMTLTNSIMSEGDRNRLFEALRFDQLESRYLSIKAAHSRTCEWLTERIEFTSWLETETLDDHHGFLWIKGKAATGKSTSMKYLLSHLKKAEAATIVAAFFFNARGHSIERCTRGMYQSILYQVLGQCPDLKCVFDVRVDASDGDGNPVWTVDSLKILLRLAVSKLGSRSLLCAIDALDECNDKEVQDMVSFFEEIGRTAVATGVQVRVLFSSRHYPHVSIDRGITLVLETQDEHNNDIVEYIRAELKAGQSPKAQQIRETILSRSSGIFLWVVLVVDILNHEYRRGRIHALEQRLKEIPDDIEKLFHDILSRGGPCSEETALCLQWVLFAKRPLRPPELYFAILSAVDPDMTPEWDDAEITISDMERYILDTSKGLLEQTRDQTMTFQFIHESVREFFLKGQGLDTAPFAPSETFAARSHDTLKLYCLAYCDKAYPLFHAQMSSKYPEYSSNSRAFRLQKSAQNLMQRFPLLDYVCKNTYFHSDAAGSLGIPQPRPPLSVSWSWIVAFNFLQKNEVLSREYAQTMLYHIADENLLHLMRLLLSTEDAFISLNERHWWLALTGLVINDEHNMTVIQSWLETVPTVSSRLPLDLCISSDTATNVSMLLREHRRSISERVREPPLLWACRYGQEVLAKMLLNHKDVEKTVHNYHNEDAVMLAIKHNQMHILRLLIRSPPFDICVPDDWIQLAVQKKNCEAIELLIDNYGLPAVLLESIHWEALLACNDPEKMAKLLTQRLKIDPNLLDAGKVSLLEALVRCRQVESLSFLFEQGLSIADSAWMKLLSAAAQGTSIEVAGILLTRLQHLLDLGHDLDALASTPLLSLATMRGNVKMVKFLLKNDRTDVNQHDTNGYLPLSHAINLRQKDIARLLLEHPKIDVNKTEFEYTPLLLAIYEGSTDMVKILLEHPSIDINKGDYCKGTPLMEAASHGNVKTVEVLLNRPEIDVNVRRHYGGQTALVIASELGHTDIVKLLLDIPDIDVNASDCQQQTPLMVATAYNRVDIVKLLLERAEIWVNARDARGIIPLMEAVRQGHVDIVELLLQHPEVAINGGESPGLLPLHAAARHDDMAILELLLKDSRTDVHAVHEPTGQTAHDIARACGNSKAARLIHEHMQLRPQLQDQGG